MILSYSHKFIFVRPMKVAGTSAEMVLSTICRESDIVSPLVPVDERERQLMGGFCGNYSESREAERFYNRLVLSINGDLLGKLVPPQTLFTNHMPIADIVEKTGISLGDFRLITIERDPYAKLISLLHMVEHFPGYLKGEDMPDSASQLEAAFDQAVAEESLKPLRSMALYADAEPEILRYENIAQDLSIFGASLNVELPPLPHAKRGAMSNNVDPRAVFRRDQLDWFNDYCADEFATFGYPTI